MPTEIEDVVPTSLAMLGELQLGALSPNAVVTEAELNAFLTGFRRESERGAILALGAAFDEVLGRALRRELEKSSASKKLLDKQFDFNEALGTFSSRIDMARCLGLIDDSLHSDIHLIRQLRNDAAHHWFDFALTEDRTKRYVDPIRNSVKFLSADPEVDPSATEQSVQPIVKLSFLAFQLAFIGASVAA